jgi:hypothetical protein
MIALTPQLVALTSGVGAVMILVGVRRGLLEPVVKAFAAQPDR